MGSFRGPRIRARNTPTRGRSSGSGSTSAGCSRPQNSSIDGYFVHRNTPVAQPSLEGTGWNRDVHEQLDIQCADFWYFNKLPFNVAASPYFLNFVTGCTVGGKGYKPPTPAALSGRLVYLFQTLILVQFYNLLIFVELESNFFLSKWCT